MKSSGSSGIYSRTDACGRKWKQIRGRLQTESPIEKFGMKPHYDIGLDLGAAACASPLRTRRMSQDFGQIFLTFLCVRRSDGIEVTERPSWPVARWRQRLSTEWTKERQAEDRRFPRPWIAPSPGVLTATHAARLGPWW
jgi:hypothetical protein